MKKRNFTVSTKNTNNASATVEEKKFVGKPLTEEVFQNKFNPAKKVGRTIRGFKKII